jgi:hypothetical protein
MTRFIEYYQAEAPDDLNGKITLVAIIGIFYSSIDI